MGQLRKPKDFTPLPLFIPKTYAVTRHRPKLHAQSCARRACPDKLTATFPTPLKIRSDSGDVAPPLIHKALRPVARSDISRCHYGDTDVPPRHGSWQGKGHATMGNARRLPKGSGRARVDITRANYPPGISSIPGTGHTDRTASPYSCRTRRMASAWPRGGVLHHHINRSPSSCTRHNQQRPTLTPTRAAKRRHSAALPESGTVASTVQRPCANPLQPRHNKGNFPDGSPPTPRISTMLSSHHANASRSGPVAGKTATAASAGRSGAARGRLSIPANQSARSLMRSPLSGHHHRHRTGWT